MGARGAREVVRNLLPAQNEVWGKECEASRRDLSKICVAARSSSPLPSRAARVLDILVCHFSFVVFKFLSPRKYPI